VRADIFVATSGNCFFFAVRSDVMARYCGGARTRWRAAVKLQARPSSTPTLSFADGR
jgi:hypothetical protein